MVRKTNTTQIQTILDQTSSEILFDEWVFEPEVHPGYTVMGIDPGTTHVGIAVYDRGIYFIWEASMNREPTMERRMLVMEELMAYAMPSGVNKLIIEGPGYMASSYRQAELEDIRCASVLYKRTKNLQMSIQIVPPNSIRKVVFGSAKIKNPWKEFGIPDNAAAALGCALYPTLLENTHQ